MAAVPVFVFNTHYNGLGVIRAFGGEGIPVVALDTHRSVGTYSRYASFVRCPDPLVQESRFVRFLIENGRRLERKPLLFPTNDQWAMALARHRWELVQYFAVMTPEWKRLRAVLDKEFFYEWAAERGFDVPITYKRRALEASTFDVRYPIVAKPVARRVSSDDPHQRVRARLYDSLRFTRLASHDEVRQYLREHEGIRGIIFQEEIQGSVSRMYTVGVYADQQSNVLGLFTGRKVRGENPVFGNCLVGQVERVPRELIDEACRLIKELGYTGVAEIEYKKDSRDERFRLLEVNPRSWSWVGITPYCGVNLPLIAYNDMVRGETKTCFCSAPTGSVKWALVMSDFKNCFLSGWASARSRSPMTLAKWLRSLRGKLVAEDCSWRDPVPSLVSLWRLTTSLASALARRLGIGSSRRGPTGESR